MVGGGRSAGSQSRQPSIGFEAAIDRLLLVVVVVVETMTGTAAAGGGGGGGEGRLSRGRYPNSSGFLFSIGTSFLSSLVGPSLSS